MIICKKMKRGAALAPLLMACVYPTVVSAQASQASGSDEVSRLDEVVVTAQRRSENLQVVPVAVAAVAAEQLENTGVQNILQLNYAVPGVNTRTNVGGASVFVRGIGTTANNVENPIALYVDGVYIASQNESGIDLPDVQQVSVLKGPQGTLFGRNATGGVLMVTTQAPSYTPRADLRIGIDNYETLKTSAYLTGGLSETIAASLAVSYTSQGEGWGRNLTRNEDTYRVEEGLVLRGKIRAELGAATDVVFAADYQSRDTSMGTNFRPYPGTQFAFPGFIETGDRRVSYGNRGDFIDSQSGGASLTINHDFGGVTLQSITAYRDVTVDWLFDSDGTANDYQALRNTLPSDSFSQELQLASDDEGSFKWVAGVYYFKASAGVDSFNILQGGPLAPLPTSFRRITTVAEERTDSLAGFAQGTYSLTEQTDVTVGIRYTDETRKYNSVQVGEQNAGMVIPLGTHSAELGFGDWTWRLALNHQFSDDIMGYVSWNRGSKSGGFNLSSGNRPPFNPETLDAFEAGLKTELFDRSLRLNMSAFYYDYTNIQLARFTTNLTIENGAQAELYGFEADFEAHFTPNFWVTGGLSLLDATFTSFPLATHSTPNPGGGLTIFSADASGNRLPMSQKYQATLSANYEHVTSSGNYLFNLSNAFNGGFFPEVSNIFYEEAHSYLSASVTWTAPDERLSLRAWGSNLLDETVLTTVNVTPVGYQTTYANPPRLYGLTLRYRY